MSKKIKKLEAVSDSNEFSLHQALLKKAMGYKVKETVEEYVVIDEEVKLSKKKVNEKYYPPDITAIEFLLNKFNNDNDIANLTDEQLENEKQKLINQLKLLNNLEKENKSNN